MHILSTIRPIIRLSSTIFVLFQSLFVFIIVVNLYCRTTIEIGTSERERKKER